MTEDAGETVNAPPALVPGKAKFGANGQVRSAAGRSGDVPTSRGTRGRSASRSPLSSVQQQSLGYLTL